MNTFKEWHLIRIQLPIFPWNAEWICFMYRKRRQVKSWGYNWNHKRITKAYYPSKRPPWIDVSRQIVFVHNMKFHRYSSFLILCLLFQILCGHVHWLIKRRTVTSLSTILYKMQAGVNSRDITNICHGIISGSFFNRKTYNTYKYGFSDCSRMYNYSYIVICSYWSKESLIS